MRRLLHSPAMPDMRYAVAAPRASRVATRFTFQIPRTNSYEEFELANGSRGRSRVHGGQLERHLSTPLPTSTTSRVIRRGVLARGSARFGVVRDGGRPRRRRLGALRRGA